MALRKSRPSPAASPFTPLLPSSSFFLPNWENREMRSMDSSAFLISNWSAASMFSSLTASLAA